MSVQVRDYGYIGNSGLTILVDRKYRVGTSRCNTISDEDA